MEVSTPLQYHCLAMVIIEWVLRQPVYKPRAIYHISFLQYFILQDSTTTHHNHLDTVRKYWQQ